MIRSRHAAAARLAALSLAAAALAGGAAASAQAKARITLDPGCYLSNDTGVLTGRGFKPNATWTAKLSGTKELGSGRTDGRGRVRARFTAPAYEGRNGTRKLTLSVTDGPNVASTTFLMSPLTASFTPESGDPARLRVRWRVLGIGPRRGVYVHYIQPNGKLKRTIRIGTSDGVCGALKTGPIALFPFRYSFGLWRFQVDTSRRWSRRTTPRLTIRFRIAKPRSASGRRRARG
ncbi:hypothetical protein [Conexibacter arvalis]|uniref:Uncharacterized protein n=1 Tax=Conexibacter arvalis TaxID=912552 RepID=A0A840IM92_9ACTN|nr:hypothetical protein [Conexibacter arvalis]MBB4664980.1 hypothetical protein [Conexibacter arvalis]